MAAQGLLIGIILILMSGCSTGQGPVMSHQKQTNSTWSKFSSNANRAASDPVVWGSLLAAIGLQIDNLDHQISDKLREETPVFGSSNKANKSSDDFRSLTSLAYASSALLVPGNQDMNSLGGKTRLLVSEWLTVQSTRWVTSGLKSITNRNRPNSRDNESLPSGHTSRAAVQTRLASLNLDRITMNPGVRDGLNWGLTSSVLLTAWGRMEAGLHYPSDVLAGWALGRFMGNIAENYIFSDSSQLRIDSEIGPDTWQFKVGITFK